MTKMHFFFIFLPKYFAMSKKSSTFAPAFDQMAKFASDQINGNW